MPRKTNPSPELLMQIYERLLADQGPRHWWPAESPFEVIVGAILTQNTQWRNVSPALDRMKAADLGTWEKILAVETPVLVEAIRPAGYFNGKARKLKVFASFIVNEFGGSQDALFALDTPVLRERLLSVWGIGEETADDIVLYAANKPSFVMDRYTMRIVDRLGWRVSGKKYADYQRLFSERLPVDVPLYNEYHALLDGHGAKVCRTQPKCAGCCLFDLCATGKGNLGQNALSLQGRG